MANTKATKPINPEKSTEVTADISHSDGLDQRSPITTPTTPPPTKSKRKISYKEFIAGKGFNRVFLAGFKTYLNGVEYLSEEKWNAVLNEYKNR